MRCPTLPILTFLGVSAACGTTASAAVLVPVVPVPNSTVTTAFAINDSNIVAGSYVSSIDGIEHAFFGTPDGNYTSFDAGSGGSEARGIANDGTIVGISNSQNGNTSNEPIFERRPGGRLQNVTMSGNQLFGLAQGINGNDKFAGYYWNTQTFATQGFVGRKASWKADVNVPAENQFTGALGINDSNVIVGYFFAPPLQGFILNGRQLTVVNYPNSNATGTILNGINNKGRVAGQWIDSKGNEHSFLYDSSTSIFTGIKVKGASVVRAWAINSAGAVAVSTDIGSFIWCKKATQCPSGGRDAEAPARVAGKAVMR
jgi:hypothetical protein